MRISLPYTPRLQDSPRFRHEPLWRSEKLKRTGPLLGFWSLSLAAVVLLSLSEKSHGGMLLAVAATACVIWQ